MPLLLCSRRLTGLPSGRANGVSCPPPRRALLRFLPLLVAFALSGSAPAGGVLSGAALTSAARIRAETTNAPAPLARVPMEFVGNHLFVPVRVNGAGPFSFVVDTGSSSSSVSEGVARRLGLRHWPLSARAEAIGGWTRLRFLRGARLELGDQQRTYLCLGALTLPRLTQRPLDGILGGDWFRHYVVALDFTARELRLYDPRTYRPGADLASVPLEFRRRLPYLQAEVGGGRPCAGQFLVDSGDSGWLGLTAGFAQSNDLIRAAGPLNPTAGHDLVGALSGWRGRVPWFRLGPFTLPGVPANFEAHPTLHPRAQAGVVGAGMLARFDAVFDYPHRRLLLANNSTLPQPYDTSWAGVLARADLHGFRLEFCGAQLAAEPPTFDRFRIARVRPGSPAERAGLRDGDFVLRLDGAPLAEFTPSQWVERTRRRAGPCQVEFQRGEVRGLCSLEWDWEWYSQLP